LEALARSGRLLLKPLVTREYRLAEAADALDDLTAGRVVRAVVTFPHPDATPGNASTAREHDHGGL